MDPVHMVGEARVVRDRRPCRAPRSGGVVSVAMSRRLTAVFLMSSLLLTACSGDDDAAATSTTFAPPRTNPPLPTTTATTTAESTSTTAVTTTEVDTTTDPSVPHSTSTTTETVASEPTTAASVVVEPNWQEIIQRLVLVFEELQRRPDAERVEEFCAGGENECQDVQGEAIRQFAAEGWHAVDYPATPVVSATLSATADDAPVESAAFVIVLVSTEIPSFEAARVVDDSGELVFDIKSSGGSGQANWLLTRSDDGAWRVLSIVGLE